MDLYTSGLLIWLYTRLLCCYGCIHIRSVVVVAHTSGLLIWLHNHPVCWYGYIRVQFVDMGTSTFGLLIWLHSRPNCWYGYINIGYVNLVTDTDSLKAVKGLTIIGAILLACVLVMLVGMLCCWEKQKNFPIATASITFAAGMKS